MLALVCCTAFGEQVDVSSPSTADIKLPDGVTFNHLCALLHLRVPAHYWLSENTFVALKKTLSELTDNQLAAAEVRVAELVRARQLANLDLRQANLQPDEFEAITLQEVILTLRRRELDGLGRKFASARTPPKYLLAHSQLIKVEIDALAAQVNDLRRGVAERPKLERTLTQDEADLQRLLDASQKRQLHGGEDGKAHASIGAGEHRLNNLVEMTDDDLYQQKARELRRRIERTSRPGDKRALRGELATL